MLQSEEEYVPATAIFLAEVMKLVTCILLVFSEQQSIKETYRAIKGVSELRSHQETKRG
jgi:hypothetical protein